MKFRLQLAGNLSRTLHITMQRLNLQSKSTCFNKRGFKPIHHSLPKPLQVSALYRPMQR